MSKTLTIRTGEGLRQALEERALAQGKTVSGLVREILQDALEERPMELRTAHLRGQLQLGRKQSIPWRDTLRDRNWRS